MKDGGLCEGEEIKRGGGVFFHRLIPIFPPLSPFSLFPNSSAQVPKRNIQFGFFSGEVSYASAPAGSDWLGMGVGVGNGVCYGDGEWGNGDRRGVLFQGRITGE